MHHNSKENIKFLNDPRTLKLQLSNAVKKIFGKESDVKGAVRDLKQRAAQFVEEEDQRLAEEAQLRAEEEAQKRAQEQAAAILDFQRAQRKQKAQEAQAEARAREEMEAKQPAPPKKQGISKNCFTKNEMGVEIPKIVSEFVEIKIAEQGRNIDGKEYKRLKNEFAKEVAQMTPEEQSEIRKYTLRTRDDTIKELLNETRDVISHSK